MDLPLLYYVKSGRIQVFTQPCKRLIGTWNALVFDQDQAPIGFEDPPDLT